MVDGGTCCKADWENDYIGGLLLNVASPRLSGEGETPAAMHRQQELALGSRKVRPGTPVKRPRHWLSGISTPIEPQNRCMMPGARAPSRDLWIQAAAAVLQLMFRFAWIQPAATDMQLVSRLMRHRGVGNTLAHTPSEAQWQRRAPAPRRQWRQLQPTTAPPSAAPPAHTPRSG